MSQNHRLPSPDCAAFAPLLPLASYDLLSEEKATALRAHLATCASCQAELAIYDQAEAALRHAFSLGQGTMPPLTKEAIMRHLVGRPDRAAASSPRSVLQCRQRLAPSRHTESAVSSLAFLPLPPRSPLF